MNVRVVSRYIDIIMARRIDIVLIYRHIVASLVVNNVDRSSLSAPCQNGLYKNKHTEQHEHAEQYNLYIVDLKKK